MIDLRILGPLELFIDGQPARLGPALRVLLLCLLVARQSVPARRLAELIWNAEQPVSWPATLRSHVYHLRQALERGSRSAAGRQMLVTERIGGSVCYALRIPPEAVDAIRFERLVTESRNAICAGKYALAADLSSGALGLWRGQPLADVAGRPFAAAEIRRLESLHRAARMAWVEAGIGLGRHREVTGDVEEMLARWPTDDGLRRLLVSCLCLAERHGEAARVCRDGIELALDQGLDVTSLEALQREVLQATPRAPAFPPAPPA
jgi:DNA-binding SARP family transcriptional activator